MQDTNNIDVNAELVPGASAAVLQEFAGCVSDLFDQARPSAEAFFAQLDAQFDPSLVADLPEAIRHIAAMPYPQRIEILDGIGMSVGADSDEDEAGLLSGFADLVDAWLIVD